MSKVLVIFSKDWADEFNVDGFRVYDSDKLESLKQRINANSSANFEYYFGTNEGWDEEVGEFFKHSYEFKEISNLEAEVIKKCFGNSFGVFPSLDSLANAKDEDDGFEEDYDDDEYDDEYDDEEDYDDDDDWV